MKIRRIISCITASIFTLSCISAGFACSEDYIDVDSTSNLIEMIQNNGCDIFSVEVNGNMATVDFQTTDDCTLLIGIYDNSGEDMLASGKLEVTPEENEVTVTIETDEMPEYFYLRGFMVDTETLAPMCMECISSI